MNDLVSFRSTKKSSIYACCYVDLRQYLSSINLCFLQRCLYFVSVKVAVLIYISVPGHNNRKSAFRNEKSLYPNVIGKSVGGNTQTLLSTINTMVQDLS
jgi:hypothetical protein